MHLAIIRFSIRNGYFFLFLFVPIDWAAEAVPKAEVLRLIYQGRFLHCNVTLGALVLPMGKTTVMHLVPRDNLPEPNSQGKYKFYFLFICSSNSFFYFSLEFSTKTCANNKSEFFHESLIKHKTFANKKKRSVCE